MSMKESALLKLCKKIVDLQNSIDGPRIDLVTVTRRFIRQGNLTLKEKGEDSSQHILLFNDIMLLTKQKLNNKTGKLTYEVKNQIALEDARVVNLSDTEDFKCAFEINVNQKSYKLSAVSEKDKEYWLKEIKLMKKDIQKKQYEQKYGKTVPESVDEEDDKTNPTSTIPTKTAQPRVPSILYSQPSGNRLSSQPLSPSSTNGSVNTNPSKPSNVPNSTVRTNSPSQLNSNNSRPIASSPNTNASVSKVPTKTTSPQTSPRSNVSPSVSNRNPSVSPTTQVPTKKSVPTNTPQENKTVSNPTQKEKFGNLESDFNELVGIIQTIPGASTNYELETLNELNQNLEHLQ